jgi:CRP/FNR family transcriptional regulator, cyclic AMP receptor protein
LINKPRRDPDWLVALLAHCHVKSYPKNTPVVSKGAPADTFYYLLEGSATVLMEDEDKRELILAYLNKGEFIGEMGLFTQRDVRDVVVHSRTDCVVAEITYTSLLHLLDNDLRDHAKDLLFAVGRHLTARLLQTSRKAGRLAFLDVAERISSTLLDLCEQPEAITHPDGMQIRITRLELGRLVGCSREMAGRVLKSMEERGLITAKGKTITVYGSRA